MLSIFVCGELTVDFVIKLSITEKLLSDSTIIVGLDGNPVIEELRGVDWDPAEVVTFSWLDIESLILAVVDGRLTIAILALGLLAEKLSFFNSLDAVIVHTASVEDFACV